MGRAVTQDDIMDLLEKLTKDKDVEEEGLKQVSRVAVEKELSSLWKDIARLSDLRRAHASSRSSRSSGRPGEDMVNKEGGGDVDGGCRVGDEEDKGYTRGPSVTYERMMEDFRNGWANTVEQEVGVGVGVGASAPTNVSSSPARDRKETIKSADARSGRPSRRKRLAEDGGREEVKDNSGSDKLDYLSNPLSLRNQQAEKKDANIEPAVRWPPSGSSVGAGIGAGSGGAMRSRLYFSQSPSSSQAKAESNNPIAIDRRLLPSSTIVNGLQEQGDSSRGIGHGHDMRPLPDRLQMASVELEALLRRAENTVLDAQYDSDDGGGRSLRLEDDNRVGGADSLLADESSDAAILPNQYSYAVRKHSNEKRGQDDKSGVGKRSRVVI